MSTHRAKWLRISKVGHLKLEELGFGRPAKREQAGNSLVPLFVLLLLLSLELGFVIEGVSVETCA